MAVSDVCLAALGCWMLFYRIALRTQFRKAAEVATTLASGASLAVFSPLMTWPSPSIRVLALSGIGMILSMCHPVFTALVVSSSVGVMLGSLLWQLGLCMAVNLQVPLLDLHAVLLCFICFAVILVFVFLPGFAGPGSMQTILVPILGAFFCAAASSSLASPGFNFGFSLARLLAEAPCDAGEGDFRPSLEALSIWLCIAVLGIAMQVAMTSRNRGTGGTGGAGGRQNDLVSALLPGARGDGEGGAALPRPGDGNDRYGLLTKAIFAAEDADVSHLTDSERKIVDVCRKDSFERDRILWGGGLI